MNAKKILLIAMLLIVTTVAKAQVAKWVIHPDYKALKMDIDNALIIGNNNGETTFWTEKGEQLGSTKDVLHLFREGKALTLKQNANILTGFFSTNGEYVKTEACEVACDFPYFSDGLLLVKKGDYLQFMNDKGDLGTGKYFSAYPFNNGMAACYTYEDLVKKKTPLCYYITTECKKISFTLKGKPVGADDVDFISSLSDDGIGIVLFKHKFYYYKKANEELQPMFEKDNETDKKKQLEADGEIGAITREEGDSQHVVTAKNGKNGRAEIYFNSLYIPQEIRFYMNGLETSVKVFKQTKHDIAQFSTSLTKTEENGKWVLNYKSIPIVGNPFDEIKILKDGMAFVRIGGNWGMIDVEDDVSFRFRINNNKPVGFRHGSYETTIRLDLPSYIPSSKTSFEIEEKDKIHIDGTSIERRDTENGNYVQYNCVIDIPTTLQDTIMGIGCHATVNYDDLTSPIIPITFNAWYVKRFNVDIIEQSGVSNGEFSFTINIDEQKAIDESDYPFEVRIAADSITAFADKLSETRYKITLSSLSEGVNEFSINIFEEGCPPQRFPFEVTYTKQVEKTKTKKAVSAKAEVRKKQTKPVSKVTTTPYIPI